MTAPRASSGQIALALGSGGARGLAHLPMLEALDDLGVRPVAIAGASMGALIGTAYAAGLSGRDIRDHVTALLADRRNLFSGLREARTGRLSDLITGLGNPAEIDPMAFCALFLPEGVPARFEDCAIPLSVSATDYYARHEQIFRSGPILPALAGSMAIPGLLRPVTHEGRVLIDGGAVNPVPFDHLTGLGVPVVAIDVNPGPGTPGDIPRTPRTWEVLFGAAQVMQSVILDEKLRRSPPALLIRPDVGRFSSLDFQQISVILRLAHPARDELKRALAALLEGK